MRAILTLSLSLAALISLADARRGGMQNGAMKQAQEQYRYRDREQNTTTPAAPHQQIRRHYRLQQTSR